MLVLCQYNERGSSQIYNNYKDGIFTLTIHLADGLRIIKNKRSYKAIIKLFNKLAIKYNLN